MKNGRKKTVLAVICGIILGLALYVPIEMGIRHHEEVEKQKRYERCVEAYDKLIYEWRYQNEFKNTSYGD